MPIKKIKLTDNEICEKWLLNKNINPETLRKIKENKVVYKKLEKKCLEQKKIRAYKKIYKLFNPYIKRITVNIIDRINYFLIIKNYLLKIKEPNNCFRLYNINEKTNEPIYRIGKNIILDKRIGSESAFGIVYLSHFKSNIKYGNKFDKLNKFAVKITHQSNKNKKEIEILELLTKKVIEFKCPHFPISYGFLKCDNSDISSNISDEYSITIDKSLFPDLIIKYKSLYIQINELASGDFDYYLIKEIKNKDNLNAFTSILLSIIFFQYYTKSHHGDIKPENFLYHKIKPSGYFHYNIYGKDYYLENKGYLWVIWDFSTTDLIIESKKSISFDFFWLLYSLVWNYNQYFLKNENNIIKKLFLIINTKYKNQQGLTNKDLYIDILNFLTDNIKSFIIIKPENIINKIPYIIK